MECEAELRDGARKVQGSRGSRWPSVWGTAWYGRKRRGSTTCFATRPSPEARADIYVAHGPHVLRGIELYGDGIIFYSIGDFLFQNETVLRQPADNYENYGLGPEAVAADFFDGRQSRGGGFPARQQVWASVCLRKAREEPEKERELRMALGLLPGLGVQEVQVPPEDLVEVARSGGLTTYDAAYLWLARELGVELVTLDARLEAACAE